MRLVQNPDIPWGKMPPIPCDVGGADSISPHPIVETSDPGWIDESIRPCTHQHK